MRKDILKTYGKRGWLPFFTSAFCFLYLLKFTWLKWGDLIVDLGREMSIPLNILSGKLLYRDVAYLYGPFSPYFNAILFKILGAHIHSLVASGIITVMVVSVLIYKLSRLFLNRLFSTFTVLTFLFVLAFGQYVYYGNYNFILPYSYPAIHGIMFSLAALYFFYRSFFKKTKCEYVYGISTALVFLCRIEMGLMLILSIMPVIIIYGLSQKENLKKIFYYLSIYVLLPFILVITIYGLFLIKSYEIIQKSNWFELGLKNISLKSPFTEFLSGTGDMMGNTLTMFKVFLYYLFFGLIFYIGSLAISELYRLRSVFKRTVFSLLTGLVLVGGGFIFLKQFFTYHLQYRCLPIICLCTIFISLLKFIKMKDRTDYLFMATISLFSLFLMLRMLLYVWAGHYGFYLLVPGIIIYYIFFFNLASGVLNSSVARRFFNYSFLFIFTIFILDHLAISRLCYRHKTLKVSSPRGTLYVFNNDREKRCQELLEFLKDNTDPKDSLVVFPEGLTINFLSDRNNPLYYYIYLPMDVANLKVTDNIASDLERKKVDYVALIQRDTSEYGYAVFGKDYAQKLWEYVLENYTLYKQFGPFPFTSSNYGIALFKRKT